MFVPGINEDIVRGNRTYHLQTEERGERNPLVVSVLFLEGAVLATERTSYEKLLGLASCRRELKKLMIRQHRGVVLRVIEGEFDGKEVQSRSLSDVEPLLFEVVTEPRLDATEARTPTPAVLTPMPCEPVYAVPTPVPDGAEAAISGVVLIDEPPTAEVVTPGVRDEGFCGDVLTSRPFDLVVALQLVELERVGWRVQA